MNEIEKYIRDIQDFPKEGVLFKDIATLLQNPKAMQLCKNQLIALVGDQKIDKVIGIESRGFFFGTLLAEHYNAGFIPVRKPGKLPYTTISESYDLEYGTDAVEIHIDAIKKGEHVLIHDDVLATGGTAKAVCQLVERLGGEIVQCNFIIQLDFLNGKDKLANYNITSILQY
ncbi:adenine phosphoribosyltransferase [Lutibacter sp.]|uniref:adenine phosphoribosyltransferase n=1 Tax=Lutibacter sp. TaxID=1925666 RepID=UPI001A344E5D|nr:adenine phosphoribosyltransferase [Lutibacter sp.]MBI9042741.1 adenine phosphoribosyltransferase [Lutibacter sp.]